MVPYISTIEWKPYDGKRPSEVRSPPRVRWSEVREHPFRGRAKRDRAPRGAEERSDRAPSSRSSEAKLPPQVRMSEAGEHPVSDRAKQRS